jgi:hypothetical protein
MKNDMQLIGGKVLTFQSYEHFYDFQKLLRTKGLNLKDCNFL